MLARASSTSASAVSPEVKSVKSVEGINLLDLVNNKSIEEQEKQSLLRQSAELNAIPQPIVPPMPPTSMLASAVSGGSSPSREVQEILSLQESDNMNEFYHDSEEIQDETDGSGNNADVADALDADENEKISNPDTDGDGDEIEDTKDDQTYTLTQVDGKWSRGITEIERRRKNVYRNNIFAAKDVALFSGQVKQEQQNNGKTDWPNVPKVPEVTNIQPTSNHLSNSPINDINYKLDQLIGKSPEFK